MESFLKKKRIPFTLFTLLSMFYFSACVSDADLSNISKDVKIDESLVMPIGSGSTSVKELLGQVNWPNGVDTVNNEICYFTSFGEEFAYTDVNFHDSILPYFKDIVVPMTIPVYTIPISLPPIDATLSFDAADLGTGTRLDSLIVNSTTLNANVAVSGNLQQIKPSDVTIEFDFNPANLKIDNGIKPVITPTAYNQNQSFTIGSYRAYLNGRTTIPFQIKVTIKPQATLIFINQGSVIHLQITFNNVDYRAAYGFFPIKDEQESTYDIPYDLNKMVPDSRFRLANPQMMVTANTNLGENINFHLFYFKAYNSAYPNNLFQAMFNDSITGNSSPETTVNMPGPSQLGSWTVKTVASLNTNNGGIDNFFNYKPYPNKVSFHYQLWADSLRKFNFITPDSKIKLTASMKIPFSVKDSSYFVYNDTIRNFHIGNALDSLDSAVLVLKISNRIPLRVNYRMTLFTSFTGDSIVTPIQTIDAGQPTGRITDNYIIEAPQVDANGLVKTDGITTQTIQIGLNKTDISHLKQTQMIVYHLKLESGITNVGGVDVCQPAHLKTTDTFSVRLGLYLKANSIVRLK